MNKNLEKYINEMADIDQRVRKMTFEHVQKTGEKYSYLNTLVYSIDGVHQYRINKIIQEFGFPTLETVGSECLKSFWLLVQHQDFDIELQRKCLENCNFEAQEKAHLTDRVLLNEGKQQMYGTQFSQGLSDEEKLIFNKNRKTIGLGGI